MKDWKELKQGDKLYHVAYWNGGIIENKREFQQVTIKKRLSNALKLERQGWNVTRNQYGSEWFSTKYEAYLNALERHQSEWDDIEETYKSFRKEINYLTKMVKKHKQSSSNNSTEQKEKQ